MQSTPYRAETHHTHGRAPVRARAFHRFRSRLSGLPVTGARYTPDLASNKNVLEEFKNVIIYGILTFYIPHEKNYSSDSMEDEEFELVPLHPVKKLEKRIEKLERERAGGEMIKELVEIVKINQEVVDDIVKINSELVNKITNLSDSVNSLAKKLDDFLNRIEVVSEEEVVREEEKREEKEEEKSMLKELEEKISKLEKRINALALASVPKEQWSKLAKKIKK